MGNHASYGVCPSGCDNDSRWTGVLPPYGRTVWKLHDASQSFLLSGSAPDEYCSYPSAGCATRSSSDNCCHTPASIVSGIARGDGPLPSFVSSQPTSRAVSRL